MRASALKYAILSFAATLVIVVIFLMPFHAFVTVWLSSIVGHYTALRLWKEVILAFCLLAVTYLLFVDIKIRSHTLTRRLIWLILLFGLVNAVWGIVAFERHVVTAKALAYGLLINLRYLSFFLVTWAIALRSSKLLKRAESIVILPAMVVIGFGILQIFLLPHDFLKHFGYGQSTISPFETINSNSHYVRILSTLRGANPLGAYLLIPLSLLAAEFVRGKRDWRRMLLFVGGLVTLLFTFSRSAWLGLIVSCMVLLILGVTSNKGRKLLVMASLIGVLVLVSTAFALRNNTRAQNIFFHTQSHSAVATTSDQGHASALKNGMRDIIHEPLGRGPGTAGPASIYNNHPPRIAENYFVQIGQETGIIGVIIYLLITLGVGVLLWLRRRDTLAFSLLASLVGLTVVNMLSHAWADDTLAYVWWGLAGLAMSAPALPARKEN